MPAISNNGIVTHARVDGPANAPTIVFSNSLGTNFHAWDEVVDHLAADFRCVRYDMRGHGFTTPTSGPYTIDMLTDDLIAVLDQFTQTRVTICGLSVGGAIAQRLAARHPERIDRLILCDTGMKIATEDLWNERIAAVQEGGVEPLADVVMTRWFADGFRERAPETWELARYMLTRTTSDGYAGVCAALRDTDLTADAGAIRIPTLVTGGNADEATPPDLMRKLADAIPNAQFKLIESVGHVCCVEAPDRLARMIATFMSETADA